MIESRYLPVCAPRPSLESIHEQLIGNDGGCPTDSWNRRKKVEINQHVGRITCRRRGQTSFLANRGYWKGGLEVSTFGREYWKRGLEVSTFCKWEGGQFPEE